MVPPLDAQGAEPIASPGLEGVFFDSGAVGGGVPFDVRTSPWPFEGAPIAVEKGRLGAFHGGTRG